MQQIARELCLSETIFVPPPEVGHACRIRIFARVNYLVVEDSEAREKLGTAVKVFAVMSQTFDVKGASAGAGDVVTPASPAPRRPPTST